MPIKISPAYTSLPLPTISTLLFLFLFLLHSGTGSCVNGTQGCQTCLTSSQCQTCFPSYQLLQQDCVNCTEPFCYYCPANNISHCTGCAVYYGLHPSNNSCVRCQDLTCGYCRVDYTNCTYCADGYGLNSSHLCSSCADGQCTRCGYNKNWCYKCNSTNSFGADGNGSCQSCDHIDPNCNTCDPYNYRNCTSCYAGYGINTANTSRPCLLCHPTCSTCSPTNYLQCQSCILGLYLNGTGCYTCRPYCQDCSVYSSCTTCANGAYITSLGDCILCPDGCSMCRWNTTYMKVQCTACIGGVAFIPAIVPTRCPDLICGDSLTIAKLCDNAVGIPYDGCDDNCQVMTDFNCTVDTNAEGTLCSFNGTLVMQVTSFKRVRLQNKLIVKVSVFPPLYVFKLSTQTQNNALFSAAMNNTEVKNITFDATTSELTIQLEMTGQITTATPITVSFTPSISIRPEYFDTQTQSLTLTIDYGNQKIYFISSSQTAIANSFIYLGYGISVLAWISCIIGLFLRHLASLEAMLVVQFSWLMILWLNVPLTLPLARMWPVKYSTGLAINFDTNITAIATESAPFTSQFRLSPSHFHSNFNMLLLLFIIALVSILVTYVRMQKFIRKNELKSIDDINKKDAQPKIKQRGQYLQGRYELAEQSLMTVTMLSIVPFASSVALFIKVGDITNAASLAMLAIGGIIILVSLIRFYWNPHPCGYFRYSFRGKPLALLHCFVHIFVLIAAITLLAALPSLSFAPIAPIALQLIFTIIYRPYQMASDNVRSVFNLLVMCAFVGFRIFTQYSSQQFLSSSPAFSIYFALYALLFGVIIIGIIFTTYFYYWFNYQLPRIRKQKILKQNNYREIVIQEMGEFDPNKPMQQVDANISFKPLIDSINTMRNFTCQLQSPTSLQTGSLLNAMNEHNSIKTKMMTNYESNPSLKIEAANESQTHHNKYFLQALMKADQLQKTQNHTGIQDRFDYHLNEAIDERQILNKNQRTKVKPKFKTDKITFQKDQDRKQFAEIALTAIKDEKKFIVSQAAILTVQKQLRQPPEPKSEDYNEAYNNIPIIKK